MRRRNVGHALNYSAEVDDEDHSLGGKVKDPVVERLKEVERALDVQGDFEKRMAQEGWAKGSSVFALKMVSCDFHPSQSTYRARNSDSVDWSDRPSSPGPSK